MAPHSPATIRRGKVYSFLKNNSNGTVLVTDIANKTEVPKSDIYWTIKTLINNRLIEKQSIQATRILKSGKAKIENRLAVKFIEPWSQKLKTNMNKTSQASAILSLLKQGRKITPLEALNNFGCFRLGARIYDLRRLGYDIQKRTIHQGEKQFAQYFLA